MGMCVRACVCVCVCVYACVRACVKKKTKKKKKIIKKEKEEGGSGDGTTLAHNRNVCGGVLGVDAVPWVHIRGVPRDVRISGPDRVHHSAKHSRGETGSRPTAHRGWDDNRADQSCA
jgi:hypothetical protein